MNTTLARLVQIEADKLMTLHNGSGVPMTTEQLEALEILCKCARALRSDAAPDTEAEESDVETDLGLVDHVP